MPYLKFELEDGTAVFVESTDPHKNAPGLIPSGRSNEIVPEKGALSFEKDIDGIRKLSAVMMKQFREGFSEEPSDIDIAFGLKASAEVGGFVIGRAGSDASFSISLHWRVRDKEKAKEKDEEGKKAE